MPFKQNNVNKRKVTKMKKTVRFLSLVLAVILAVSCFSALSAVAATPQFQTLYVADKNGDTASLSKWVSTHKQVNTVTVESSKTVAKTAWTRDAEGTHVAISATNLANNASITQTISEATTAFYDYNYLPFVTYYINAPETALYEIHASFSGTAAYIGMSVNDKNFYQLANTDTSGNTSVVATKSVPLVKGNNYIRIVLVDDTTRGNTMYFNYLEVPESVTPVVYGSDRLMRVYSAEYTNGRIDTAESSKDYLGNLQNVNANDETKKYYNKRGSELSGYNTVSGDFKSMVPFYSHTVDFAEGGYYDMTFQMDFGTTGTFTSCDFYIYIDGNTRIAAKFYKRANQNSNWINVSAYIPAGTHTITVTAPYNMTNVSSGEDWMNMWGLYIRGRVGASRASLQKDPTKVTNTFSAPAVTTATTTLAAVEYGIPTGQEYNFDSKAYAVGGSSGQGNYYRLGGSYYFKEGTKQGNVTNEVIHGTFGQKAAKTNSVASGNVSDFAGKYVIGGLEDVSKFAHNDLMQSLEQMQTEGFLLKTYLPIVSYQVKVEKAGNYNISVAAGVELNYGYAFNDYYMVVSANDTQYAKAYVFGDIYEQRKYALTKGEAYEALSPSVSLWLNEGVNVIRCIAAVQENAKSIIDVYQAGIKIQGPAAVTGLKSNDEHYYDYTDNIDYNPKSSNIHNFNTLYLWSNGKDYVDSEDYNIRRGDVVGGQNILTALDKGITYENVDESYENIGLAPYLHYTVDVTYEGYYDIDLCFNSGVSTIADTLEQQKKDLELYKQGKFILILNGQKSTVSYKNSANTRPNSNDGQVNNNCNLSMYLQKGENHITLISTLFEEVMRSNAWFDFGAIRFNNITLSADQNYIFESARAADTKRLQAQEMGLASNAMFYPKAADGNFSLGGYVTAGDYNNNFQQAESTLGTYVDKSNNAILTFMVEAPEDGEYSIYPSYYLEDANNRLDIKNRTEEDNKHYDGNQLSRFKIPIIVNDGGGGTNSADGGVYWNYFKDRATVDRHGNATTSNFSYSETKVILKKGVNVIRLLTGYGHMTDNFGWNWSANGTTNAVKFDYLDIDSRLNGIKINRVNNGDDYSADYNTWGDRYKNVLIVRPTGDSTDGSSCGENAPVKTIQAYNENAFCPQNRNYGNESQSIGVMYHVYNRTDFGINSASDVTYANVVNKKVPYVSVTVTAAKDGYYDISALVKPDVNNTSLVGALYSTENKDRSKYSEVAMFVDGVMKKVPFNYNLLWYKDPVGGALWEYVSRNVIDFSTYLTKGTHTLVFTTCIWQDGTFKADALMDYAQFEFAGGLTYATTQVTPAGDSNGVAESTRFVLFKAYLEAALARVNALADIPEVRNSAYWVTLVKKLTEDIGYNSNQTLDVLYATVDNALSSAGVQETIAKFVEDTKLIREQTEAEDTFNAFRDWAADAVRSLLYTGDGVDICDPNPNTTDSHYGSCDRTNDVLNTHDGSELSDEVERIAKEIEAKRYSDYNNTSYEQEFIKKITDLDTWLTAARKQDAIDYRTAMQNNLFASIESDTDYSETAKQLYKDFIEDQFDKIVNSYDGTTPYHVPHMQLDNLYDSLNEDLETTMDNIDEFEKYKEQIKDEIEDERGKGTEKVDNQITDSKKEIDNTHYDPTKDLDENKEIIDDLKKKYEEERDKHNNASKAQSAIWVQYQTYDNIEEYWGNQNQLYLRFFFEIDTKLNDYTDYGFIIEMDGNYWGQPLVETISLMGNKPNGDDGAVDYITEWDETNGTYVNRKPEFYFEKFGINSQCNGTPDKFIFTYFIIPVEMYDRTITVTGYFTDKNGQHTYKAKTINLRTWYHDKYGKDLPTERTGE